MSIFYSAATGGFYCADIHGDAIPVDAVAIDADRHVELLRGQAAGKSFGADVDGAPILTDPPAITWDAVRAERDRRLAISDYTQMADAPIDAAAKEAWRVYRQSLRDLPATLTDPALIVWPEAPTV